MPDLLHTALPALGALAAVLGLVLLAARLAQRFGPGRIGPAEPSRRLSIHESLPLDRTRRLQLIRCDDRECLIISGGAGIDTVVGWLPEPGGRA